MATRKRSTIHFSDVVGDAVRQTLSKDAADLEVFEKRRGEPALDFEAVVLRLRRGQSATGRR